MRVSLCFPEHPRTAILASIIATQQPVPPVVSSDCEILRCGIMVFSETGHRLCQVKRSRQGLHYQNEETELWIIQHTEYQLQSLVLPFTVQWIIASRCTEC